MLGLSENNTILFEKIVKSLHGIVLAGADRLRTTLYTVLKDLNQINHQYRYRRGSSGIPDGRRPVQVNVRAGMTFATGLRPFFFKTDIILVGEIRDSEIRDRHPRFDHRTSGLVPSTNDAASTVTRLVDMGDRPVSVSFVGRVIFPEALVRKICPRCKESYKPHTAKLMQLKLREPKVIFRGTGCLNAMQWVMCCRNRHS